MTGAEFEERLQTAFTAGGIPYRRANAVRRAEAEYGEHVEKLGGYIALSEALKCLYLESVELLESHCRPQVKTPLSEYYALFLPRLSNAFHAACGAERAAVSGYPLPAYTVLRNIYDNNVLTSAALQRVTSFYAIEGIDPSQKFDPIAAQKLRKREELSVVPKMTGKDSGMSQDTIDELRKWDALFDAEVHGSRLSLADAMPFMKGVGPLPALPQWKEQSFALFMNRFTEVCWTIHRLIPMMQPPGVLMPDDWAARWKVVDDSHELAVVALSADLGKKIGNAFKELVDTKFPFDSMSAFPL